MLGSNDFDATVGGPSRTELVLGVSGASGMRVFASDLVASLANAVFMSPWLNDQLRLILLGANDELLFDSHIRPFDDLIDLDHVLDGGLVFDAWASAPPPISAGMTVILDDPAAPMQPRALTRWPTLLWVVTDMECIRPHDAPAAWHADGVVVDTTGTSTQLVGAMDRFVREIVETGVGAARRDWHVRHWISECAQAFHGDVE